MRLRDRVEESHSAFPHVTFLFKDLSCEIPGENDDHVDGIGSHPFRADYGKVRTGREGPDLHRAFIGDVRDEGLVQFAELNHGLALRRCSVPNNHLAGCAQR